MMNHRILAALVACAAVLCGTALQADCGCNAAAAPAVLAPMATTYAAPATSFAVAAEPAYTASYAPAVTYAAPAATYTAAYAPVQTVAAPVTYAAYYAPATYSAYYAPAPVTYTSYYAAPAVATPYVSYYAPAAAYSTYYSPGIAPVVAARPVAVEGWNAYGVPRLYIRGEPVRNTLKYIVP